MNEKEKNQDGRIVWITLGLVLVAFLLTQTGIGTALLASPWWVYFVLAGIVLSGYLSLKYTIEDQQIEKKWIEKEGEVYMTRIEEARERKHEQIKNQRS
ncbi:sporulation YhaL family protein [Halalkalibacterium ligniniphilum]|uniref:sporulation YhaL family protein n=1 Tax=Halalkalibacterium ligniniphilum TaxID=1134413 RepID=UPI0003452DEB|nr:sporulation YhaL family protein [Halalkalibacterium ligniniphilum]